MDADSFGIYADTLQAAALATTRLAATSLPADLAFHRSIDAELARDVDAFSDRVLALANKLVHIASGKASRMREEEDVTDDFVRNIVDPMEGMLERTDSALDVYLGKRKEPAIHVPAVPVEPRPNKPKKQKFHGRLDPALAHASHIRKPQLLFKHTISNADESLYTPATLMPHKWCAKVPLGYVFHDDRPSQDIEHACQDDEDDERTRHTLHPYYYELTHPTYPDHVFNPPAEPSPPLDLHSSASHPLTFVSTPKELLSMANTISSEAELAVDLEHHSYRSYKGFLALMQISTRKQDFVVDLLVPEIREGLRQAKGKSSGDSVEARIASEAGRILARVFADPSVVKVLHGAESDIVWLQQDFNIFVVGLFDTFHASKLLELPKHSLAYLLENFCDFLPDKRYQLADWRIRPLPDEMLTYARSDTHFLLYAYDILRLSLVQRSTTDLAMPDDTGTPKDTKQMHLGHELIRGVLSRSARTALRLYENEIYDAESGTGSGGWDSLARKWNKVGLVGSGVDAQGSQAIVYKAVHRWREDVAREEDESTRYVLSTHQLFLLAEHIPTTVPDLLSLFGGPGRFNGSVPPVLKRRTGELVAVIKCALEATKPASSPRLLAEDGGEDAKSVVPTIIEESGAMNSTAQATKPTSESRLWTVTLLQTPAATTSAKFISHSSLFGIGISGGRVEQKVVSPSSAEGKTYLARGSALFGGTLTKTTTASSSCVTKSTFTRGQVSSDTAERFKDVMEKIHKTLVIAPAVSASLLATSLQTQGSEVSLSDVVDAEMVQNDASMREASELSSGPTGQIEIPFIPAYKRQSLSKLQNYEPKDDTIVVVGQAGARQRKRKRDKARGVSSTSRDLDQQVEDFDYSSVPNLLDDESKRTDMPEGEERRKKKKHGKGSGLFEFGNFRAPPRDQREVRSGNKTHTFTR